MQNNNSKQANLAIVELLVVVEIGLVEKLARLVGRQYVTLLLKKLK